MDSSQDLDMREFVVLMDAVTAASQPGSHELSQEEEEEVLEKLGEHLAVSLPTFLPLRCFAVLGCLDLS